MSLKRNETYPGRFSNPTPEQPQGAFKNRSAPGAQDGSFCEQQWANDWSGFFSRLLTVAGISPNGTIDNALVSQYFDALRKITLQRQNPFGDIKSDGVAAVATALTNLGIPDAAYALIRTQNLRDLNSTSEAVTNLGLDPTVQQASVALDRTKNLSDLNSIPAARNTLGILPVGTTNNTVAAGNDSRITGAMQKSSNLSDVGDVAAARNNLGLKSGAVTDIATQSEVTSGIVGKIVTAVTLSGFFDLGSTAVNGSIRIPNRPGGILIAWGTAAAGSDGTFTTSFNNPPFVMPQVASGQGSGAFAPDHVVVQSVTNTGFSTYNQSLARKYIAIGK